MIRPQFSLDIHDELIVDNFAGGGGASTGIELALGRNVDIAINHDPVAVAMHQANHPQTKHFCEDVFKVHPLKATGGRPVGLAWFSPDCKHFSKAKGGKPRSKKIRGLAWVVVKWAASFQKAGLPMPRVIILENVEEFQDWGPLLKCGSPCPERKGKTFRNFIARLKNLGYAVEWKELRACDYGAPTIRKRLFLIARCDGKPIVWPASADWNPRAKKLGGKLKRWRTAAECIDWSIPCHSIFLSKEQAKVLGIKRPLADATMRRLARGVFKFVINSKEPFIVPLTHQGGARVEAVSEPFRTITGAHRGEKALAVPYVAGCGGRMGQSPERSADAPMQTLTAKADAVLSMPILTEHANASGQRSFPADEPMRTQCAEVKGGHFALVQSFLAKHYTGVDGSKLSEPIGTVTSVDHHSLVSAHMQQSGHYSSNSDMVKRADEPLRCQTTNREHALVATHLSKLYGTTTGQKSDEPLHTVTGGGQHIAEVRAFLQKYYGNEKDGVALQDPLHTVTTKDRLGLVTVEGALYAISDIGMRMLVPRELYRGQGFPDSYIIDLEVTVERRGKTVRKKLSQEAQVRMCGNSVCPPMAAALVAANVPELSAWNRGERLPALAVKGA